MEYSLRGVILNELNAKVRGLSFLKSKKRGGNVRWGERSDEVRVLEVGQRGINGRVEVVWMMQ